MMRACSSPPPQGPKRKTRSPPRPAAEMPAGTAARQPPTRSRATASPDQRMRPGARAPDVVIASTLHLPAPTVTFSHCVNGGGRRILPAEQGGRMVTATAIEADADLGKASDASAVATHEELEAALIVACAAARQRGRPLALARIHVDPGPPPAAVERVLARVLGPGARLAAY